MCFRPTLTLAVVCLTLVCVSQCVKGKALGDGNTDDIEGDEMTVRDFYRLLTKRSAESPEMGAWPKRDIQPIGMEKWTFCYRMRMRHPLCINRPNQQMPKIVLTTV